MARDSGSRPGELGRPPAGIARERETDADGVAPRQREYRPTFFVTGGVRRRTASDEERSDGAFVAFRYDVRHGDRDEDGLSSAADALDPGDSTIRNEAGVDADVSIADHASENLSDQLVAGTPPQRVCTDEAQRARDFAPPMRERDGTPFRVDLVRNFPDCAAEADLQQLPDSIGRLADQIELQLGYPVVEMGDLIEVPARAPAGWNQDFDRYLQNELLPRERGQLLAFYLDDDNDFPWGGRTGSPLSADVCCGTTSYHKRGVGPMWTGDHPCPGRCKPRHPRGRSHRPRAVSPPWIRPRRRPGSGRPHESWRPGSTLALGIPCLFRSLAGH